jgi:hypothetical protein
MPYYQEGQLAKQRKNSKKNPLEIHEEISNLKFSSLPEPPDTLVPVLPT